jgi:hypothetical protein
MMSSRSSSRSCSVATFLLASGSARSNWPNRSGLAFSAFTIIGFHLPSITSAVALTGHSESFMSCGSPRLQKGAYWTIDRCMPTIISQKLKAAKLDLSQRQYCAAIVFCPKLENGRAPFQPGSNAVQRDRTANQRARRKGMVYGGFTVLAAA